jgi:hypothetical protein
LGVFGNRDHDTGWGGGPHPNLTCSGTGNKGAGDYSRIAIEAFGELTHAIHCQQCRITHYAQ